MILSPFRLILIPTILMGLAACSDSEGQSSRLTIAGGEPEQGRALIQAYGCGTCHTIEDVRGARGKVGPRLENYAQQHLLAGFLPNTPLNLIAWLMDPPALKPNTGMPAQGVSEAEARHIAAYLYSLGREGMRVYPQGPPLQLRAEEEVTADIPNPPAVPEGTDVRTRRIVPNPDGSAPKS
ncbi:c-type cytochrome [Microvirga splendida]|uniref:C-type cytochrome n=1 Tax=Microvirga splendida TaxID=2795727 RepID=A0ABS0Y191_9HYPH|nr:c-type cytochrome [Microvirga splendida]MBJ6125705.1 c-type cytochrome [Microvirga splendida]